MAPADGEHALRALTEKLGPEINTPPAQEMFQKFGGWERTLRRFLRGAGGHIHHASTRFLSTLKWRSENKVGELDQELWDQARPHWPAEYPGFTTDGSPVQYCRVQRINPRFWLSSFREEQMEKFMVQWVELGVELQRKSLEANRGDVRGVVVIYDLKDISRQHLELRGIRVLAKIFGTIEKHYPENLYRAYILNTPYYFAFSWKILSRVLSAETNRKVVVCRDNCEKRLAEVMDPADIPAVLSSVPPPTK
eukprot:RCo033170